MKKTLTIREEEEECEGKRRDTIAVVTWFPRRGVETHFPSHPGEFIADHTTSTFKCVREQFPRNLLCIKCWFYSLYNINYRHMGVFFLRQKVQQTIHAVL